jgi:hypothetical protein
LVFKYLVQKFYSTPAKKKKKKKNQDLKYNNQNLNLFSPPAVLQMHRSYQLRQFQTAVVKGIILN